jgi:hypothetical protein
MEIPIIRSIIRMANTLKTDNSLHTLWITTLLWVLHAFEGQVHLIHLAHTHLQPMD